MKDQERERGEREEKTASDGEIRKERWGGGRPSIDTLCREGPKSDLWETFPSAQHHYTPIYTHAHTHKECFLFLSYLRLILTTISKLFVFWFSLKTVTLSLGLPKFRTFYLSDHWHTDGVFRNLIKNIHYFRFKLRTLRGIVHIKKKILSSFF